MTGTGIGGALLPQFTARMMSAYGWRGAYIGLGALTLISLVNVPLSAFLPTTSAASSEPCSTFLKSRAPCTKDAVAPAPRALFCVLQARPD